MKYKIVYDNPGEYGCVNCINWGNTDKCTWFVHENNLPDCFKNNCHFEEDLNPDIPGPDTDCMGNCFSDADPGL